MKFDRFRNIGLKTGFLLCIVLAGIQIVSADDLKLWYEQPAEDWTHGLPIGNGRLLAVVQGGIEKERIQFNEDTLWTGQPIQRDKPDGWKYLDEVRQLMFEGKYWEAERLVKEKMMGLRVQFGSHTYQTMGDLNLSFSYPSKEKPSDYRRELDLETAITSVCYTMGGVTYTRELFSSPVDQAILIRLSCDKPGQLNFNATLSRAEAIVETPGNKIVMSGSALGYRNTGWRGVSFESQIEVKVEDGTVKPIKNGLRVENANSVTLRMVAATNFRGEDEHAKCERQLMAVAAKSYADIRQDHIAEYQRLFDRVDLSFGSSSNSRLPTDGRLEAFARGAKDPALVALYFQFGRYLLISSSRPNSMAVNLWGKWIDGLKPDYNGDYHININIQMNYWPAEVCNLSECHEPFINLVDNLRPRGRVTAKETYNCKGFTFHHATDAWYYTAVIGNPPYGMWPLGAAWSCQHMWEHYLFGGDLDYLRNKSYPIMKEAAEFFVDYLVEHPKTGYMVSGPSTSPENRFIDPNTGKTVSVSLSPTMDIQLINDLFSNTIEASKILRRDRRFRETLEKLQARLMPMQIGEDGRLMEWSEPFEEQNKAHRHISHLWGLSPGNQITDTHTPELFEAARKALDVRVEHGAAESPEYQGIAAWVMCSYTRLLDGDKAYGLLNHILSNSSWPNLFAVGQRGRTRKMFETDVNFGATSAIAEFLLQSHDGSIRLLPALPSSLSEGKVHGLRARGVFEVDLEWADGELRSVTVKSLKGGPCRLKYGEKLIEFETKENEEYRFNGSLEIN